MLSVYIAILQIETVFSSVKAWLRRNRAYVATVTGGVAIDAALRSITPAMCQNMIRHSGQGYNDFYNQ